MDRSGDCERKRHKIEERGEGSKEKDNSKHNPTRKPVNRHCSKSNVELPADQAIYIREDELCPNPMLQFRKFFAQRDALKPTGPPAMVLTTANAQGKPSLCTVILNGFDENSFIFFTDSQSTKGRNISVNPLGAIVFFWPEMMLQVRAEGKIIRGSEEDCAHCFGKMPRNLLNMAAAYKQGTIILDRETYVERVKAVWLQNPSSSPYPDGWWAYRLIPDRMEFWNGTGTSLVVDRIEYVLQTPCNDDTKTENMCTNSDREDKDEETPMATKEAVWKVFRLAAP